ncbi:MAG: RluA family pseudouridine synthase [Lachnospiraceae bacterium]|nr:RluA family pseudouridine synthase [Lachnospiraceae bacterium]
MESLVEFTISSQNRGDRIDKVITSHCEEYSRSFVQKLVKDGKVIVNGKTVKSNYRVEEQDKVSFVIPEPVGLDILPEPIELDILYEDEDIIVINKGKGMVVHPAAGHYSGTIVNGLLYHCKNQLSGINGIMRPGIVHRIDKNTTGAIVACKNDKAHRFIAEQLKEHSITRKYRAIVWNTFKDSNGTIDAPIGRHPTDRKKMAINERNGKHAITHYRVLDNLDGKFAHIECQLETGRTHQIRVHMASIHHPLLGDDVYGSGKNTYKLEGQTLHAMVLGFIHPTTKKYIEFEAPLPAYYLELLGRLQK